MLSRPALNLENVKAEQTKRGLKGQERGCGDDVLEGRLQVCGGEGSANPVA